MMRTAIAIGAPGTGPLTDFGEISEYVQEAEKLGVDCVWSAEAWGYDAVSPLAFLAGRTNRILLGTGIMQISARAPAMTAMTAITMDALSEGRFLLGLGASGPQVVEGLHGKPYAGPLTRMHETIEIVRQAFDGERIAYDGKYHQLPLPGGQGKSLRLAVRPNRKIPIYLATLAPAPLRKTGELADGWVGTSFVPEAAEAHFEHLRQGAEGAGRSLKDLDLQVATRVSFTDDPSSMMKPLKAGMAFTLGAMGSARTNFYNDAYKRAGWEDVCKRSQGLWVEGKREEAAEVIPDEMIYATNAIGDESAVKARLDKYQEVGINTLQINPSGRSLGEMIETLGRTLRLME